MPVVAGLLQRYVERNASDPERFRFLLPIYRRTPARDAVVALHGAHVVGFSTYVWNGCISLEIARRLKQDSPETVIIFGGPHVPDYPEGFLRENRFIDIAVHNEGEATFLELLEILPGRDWAAIAGISYIDRDDRFVRTADRARFRDLDDVPSPYVEGTFEPLMNAHPGENWIGLWETNRGCPFECTFCDWGSATAARVNKFGLERLKQEADWFAAKKIEYIFCCDANFGILQRDVDIAEYVAHIKKTTGYPTALSVQNTKNATERAYLTQKILSDAGLNKGVAVSMQSVDTNTLISIKRDNISLESYLELQRRFTRDGVETYSDLILGLPGETYDSFADGIDRLIESGQHNRIQFNNLSILPNAEMGDPAYQAKFGMVTVESTIINIHGERTELDDDVPEVQELVIATASMPAADWRKTRTLCWITALLHFDKLFQMPLIVAHETTGVRYRDMFEAILHADETKYPLLAGITRFFMGEAERIQKGGTEYVFSRDWLNMYWPADEYIFIKLTHEGTFGRFCEEAGALLMTLAGDSGDEDARGAITDAVRLNRAMVKQPYVTGDVTVTGDYDISSFCRAVRDGQPAHLRKQKTRIVIDRSSARYDDFQLWCREVVWWGNKKGAYLYGGARSETELAGHF
ncbi:MAG: radical SAM protein [Verrucomicrobia bacterium]|nr:radical SAM protein [Verrucomicrobiota bacterium]